MIFEVIYSVKAIFVLRINITIERNKFHEKLQKLNGFTIFIYLCQCEGSFGFKRKKGINL